MSYTDKSFNVKNYTDIQGLTELKGRLKHQPNAARKEVAQQFEALLTQMLMKSMRSASKAFGSDEGHSEAYNMYQELLDKQMALTSSSLGLAKQIEDQLQQLTPSTVEDEPFTLNQKSAEPKEMSTFEGPGDFINSLWSYAKSAARQLGLNPEILLAQAALETDWGQQIIRQGNESSFNLFNIKADPSWKEDTADKATLEAKDGIFQKEKASFRKYGSFADSFKDYVQFISNNPRYSQARRHGGDPEQYIRSLQQANYATDNRYAEKVLTIYHSKYFKNT